MICSRTPRHEWSNLSLYHKSVQRSDTIPLPGQQDYLFLSKMQYTVAVTHPPHCHVGSLTDHLNLIFTCIHPTTSLHLVWFCELVFISRLIALVYEWDHRHTLSLMAYTLLAPHSIAIYYHYHYHNQSSKMYKPTNLGIKNGVSHRK